MLTFLLRLQVQMLLEAQGRFQPPAGSLRSTASVAVGTGAFEERPSLPRVTSSSFGVSVWVSGASLFWADADPPASAPEAPGGSSETPPPPPPLPSSPGCSHRRPPDAHLPAARPEDDGAGDAELDLGGQGAGASPLERSR